MKRFYVITNRHKDPEMKVTEYIRKFVESNGGTCLVHSDGQPLYPRIPEPTECLLVLGGDGTVLQAARDTLGLNIPILGINMGTMGYLAEVELPGLESALSRLINDEYELEDRMMLAGAAGRTGERDWALNDITITRKGSLQIINYSIFVNNQFLYSYSADGIIVSTPTGSTGYNLSAGGPIVEPKAKLLLVTPVCPHTLNTRSIILPEEDVIGIEIGSGREGRILEVEASFDGSHNLPLRTGDRITIERAEKKTVVVKMNQVSFLEILHKKMNDK